MLSLIENYYDNFLLMEDNHTIGQFIYFSLKLNEELT